jgi:hypothetical protein
MKTEWSGMEVGSQWYNRIAAEISQYTVPPGRKDVKKYKPDLLLRVARRVDDFSQTCDECRTYQKEIEGLVQELDLLVQKPDRQQHRKYTKAVFNITEHLKKVHKLVDKGHYVGIGISIGMAVGAGIGAALGAAFDNPGLGTGVGIALGAGVGAYLDRKAKEEGRVI